jgi:hypothetical protein
MEWSDAASDRSDDSQLFSVSHLWHILCCAGRVVITSRVVVVTCHAERTTGPTSVTVVGCGWTHAGFTLSLDGSNRTLHGPFPVMKLQRADRNRQWQSSEKRSGGGSQSQSCCFADLVMLWNSTGTVARANESCVHYTRCSPAERWTQSVNIRVA